MIQWYVLHSKPNKEDFVVQQLSINNIDAYYPYLKVQPANPRSRKTKPYLPGYLFVNADLDTVGTSLLKWIPGAIGLVDFGGVLASVPDQLVQAIRFYLERMNNANNKPQEKYLPGDKVVIQSGLFAGFQAIFDAYLPGHERVRVLLKALHDRQLKIELSEAWVDQIDIYQSCS
jgi:transcription antitermination factor NusG